MPRSTDNHSGSIQTQNIPNRRWWYIIPVSIVMYMLAYLDRTNTAIILPYISKDPNSGLNLSAANQGMASGIFFVGYMFLQIPAAVLAERWSAKKTVCILMVFWGFSAMATALVQNNNQFFLGRFVLGFFEGGVWPSVLVLIACWFPLKERGRANALWMCCLPVSSIIISPLSGYLLEYFSWRTVLFIEGIPPILWAIVWMLVVADHPRQAKWVSPAEQEYIEIGLAADEAAKPKDETGDQMGWIRGYLRAMGDRRVLLLILIYFCWMSGFYGYTMWLPTVIKRLTRGSSGTVGLLTAIPYAFAVMGMLWNSAHSDKTSNRRNAVAFPLLLGAAAMVAGQFVHIPVINIIVLIIMAVAIYAPYGPFWAIPAGLLRIEVLAGALGLINAIGNLGGFLGPYAVGWITEKTGSPAIAYFALAGILTVGALVTLFTVKSTESRGEVLVTPLRDESQAHS